ncbi:MAG: hypothetical protein KF773_32230 [Deltaproteobacteria bacterium]|nr:hypothetical protein [Deltaproteobacteria bacterium]
MGSLLDWDMRDAETTDRWQGPYGGFTASERLNNHYAGQNDPSTVKNHELGPMETREQREAVMAEMRQNNGNSFGDSGYAQCGSTAMTAAAVYGGGEQGVVQLMDAAQNFEKLQKAKANEERKRQGLPPLPEEHVDMAALDAKVKAGKSLTPAEQAAQGNAQMDALKDKLAKGEHMTSDEMQMVQSNMYRVLNKGRDDGMGSGAGIDAADMAEFLKSSPAMAKMFRDNDMHLENIATAGQASSNHFVLGIGHNNHKGMRETIYDPQARVQKTMDDDGNPTVAKNPNGSVKLDSQVVKNWDDLRDYQELTRSEIDANGWHAPGATKMPKPAKRKDPFGR